MAVWMARKRNLKNFQRSGVARARAAVDDCDPQAAGKRVQGFSAPDTSCTVMGYEEYNPIAKHLQVPIVITGFERSTMSRVCFWTVRQLEAGEAKVENSMPARSGRRAIFIRAGSSTTFLRSATASGAASESSPRAVQAPV